MATRVHTRHYSAPSIRVLGIRVLQRSGTFIREHA